MPSTAVIRILGEITGLPEGGSDQFSLTLVNTTAQRMTVRDAAVTTSLAGALKFSGPACKFMIFVPDTTNTMPIRYTHSTSDTGILLSSNTPSLISVGADSTHCFYTTGGTTAHGRVMFV